MVVDVIGGKEIFKGKQTERQMKQATENILRNDSIYGLEERCPLKRQGNQKQCHVSRSDIQLELTSIGGPLFTSPLSHKCSVLFVVHIDLVIKYFLSLQKAKSKE